VGAIVEPLTGQMAEYLGVPSGLMVKQVAHKSEASAAGFKAFDVILKVGPDAVTTLSDWDRALRANQGKPVQVTILRDRKQQTLNLQVDSKHKTGALELEPLVPSGDGAEMAELEGGLQAFGPSAQKWAQGLLEQAQGMENEAKELGNQIQTLQNSDSFQLDNFKISQKQMDDLKQQIDRFEKGFKAEDFKVDPALADELRKQAEALGDPLKMQDFKMEDFKIDQKQLDDLKQQMDQFRDMLRPQELPGTGVTGPPV
jgi:membrane-associated protease RseP (regulator of RpoE activity)